jgi:cytochrome P450
LAPPVSLPLVCQVLPGGIALGNEHIPEGARVGTAIYTLHHDKTYFPGPFLFKPERWIVNPELGYAEESVNLAQSASLPFSYG